MKLRRMSADPHFLKGFICIGFYYSMHPIMSNASRKEWIFYLRFEKRKQRKTLYEILEGPKAKPKRPDSWEDVIDDNNNSVMESGVLENPDEHCYILRVRARSFVQPRQSVLGMRLHEVCNTISVGSAVSLRFVPAHQNTLFCDNNNTIDIGDVADVQLIPWYYPNYATTGANGRC